MEHADYPHTPGALPGCPACDLELARQAYAEIHRGTGRCYGEVMELLDQPHKRLVEIAVMAEQTAKEDDIPVRDALHKLSFNDRTKAQVAEWICPDATEDWTGSFDERRAAQDANQDRARVRLEDRVLANQPESEAAASIRDHRANALNQIAGDARQAERELLELAQEEYDVKNENLRLMQEAHDRGDYGWQATYRDRAAEADTRGSARVHSAIQQGQIAQRAELECSDLLQANAEYDRLRAGDR